MGVEPSAAMGRIARRRGIVVVRGAAEALPFANGAFEGALFVTTICFVDDLAASLREAHRVLRPGGAILVGFVDRESPLGHEYANRKAENPFYRTATFYSAGELAGSMEREGFHGFAYAQTIFHPLDQIRDVEPTTEGHGRGSFVVMRAIKPGTARLSATADSP